MQSSVSSVSSVVNQFFLPFIKASRTDQLGCYRSTRWASFNTPVALSPDDLFAELRTARTTS